MAATGIARPGGTEFLPPPSFDACYPWQESSGIEPPALQLFARRPPAAYLMVMPGYAVYGDAEAGWKSGFGETEFAALWELSKLARQQHAHGDDLSGDDIRKYILSIECGDFYSWLITINEGFAETGSDAAADLARQLFALIDNPPADAMR